VTELIPAAKPVVRSPCLLLRAWGMPPDVLRRATATRPASKSEIAAKDHEKLVFDDLALLEERYAVQVWSGR
jgi:hypothetical protein